MKQFACAALAFVIGVIVGTAGSDDSLLEEARRKESSSYDRGYADATSAFKTLAVQRGLAKWEYDPHTGLPSQFLWTPPNGDKELHDLTLESFAITGWPDQQTKHLP